MYVIEFGVQLINTLADDVSTFDIFIIVGGRSDKGCSRTAAYEKLGGSFSGPRIEEAKS